MRRVRDLAVGQDLRGVQGKRALRQRVTIDDARRAVESVKNEPFEVFVARHGDWERPLFLWLARRYCGLSLREIGQVAGGMNESAVGMALKRFEERLEGSRELVVQRERAVNMLDVKP